MICESCRFGFPEEAGGPWYCEAKDEKIGYARVCPWWACKLAKIGTREEFQHSAKRQMEMMAERKAEKEKERKGTEE